MLDIKIVRKPESYKGRSMDVWINGLMDRWIADAGLS
jgi:hypothetical protein